MFEDSGPPSDRERLDEWRRMLFDEVRRHGEKLDRIATTLLAIALLLAFGVARLYGWT